MVEYALSGTLRAPLPLEALEAKLAEGYRTEHEFEGSPGLMLVTEVTEVIPIREGTLRFRLRWDQAVQREDEQGTVWGRNINRVNVATRMVGGEPLVFIHSLSRPLCVESRGSVSRVLTGLNAQIMPLRVGPILYQWIENHDAAHLIGAGVRRPHGTGIRTFRLGGDFDVSDAEWATIRDSGLVVYLRYESHDGNVYAAYTNGTFLGDGPSMSPEALEEFVITKVLRRLEAP